MGEKRGPWIFHERKTIYSNPWMDVYEDQVTRPDGKPGIYGVADLHPGISVLPIDGEGFVYLADEFAYAINKQEYGAVSGFIDKEEVPLVTAKRELKEELGIEADEWIELGVVNPLTGQIYAPAYVFLARSLRFGKDKQDAAESITMVKLPFAEAVRMVMESEITHAPSCVLILKVKEYLVQHP